MIKNVAGQRVVLHAVKQADGDAITTGVTARVSKDGAAFADSANAPVHLEGSTWALELSQAETDADVLVVRPVATDIQEMPERLYPVVQDEFKATGFALATHWTETRAGHLDADVSSRSSHSDPTSGITTHGDSNWATATGFAEPGDAMTLTPAERTAIKDALEAVGGKLDTAYRRRTRLREDAGVWYYDIIDGNGDVVLSLACNEAVGEIPAFDRVGAEPNA